MIPKYSAQRHAQEGFALIILLALLGFIVIGVLLTIARSSAGTTERERHTSQALAKAKEALVAYAVAVQPNSSVKRPGDLPCPDLNNDGQAEPTCAASTQRIGRLPWKTLGLSDLREGDGERLWYALSTNFQRKTVNQCTTPGGPSCLNSEMVGTITVHDATGNVISNGTDPVNGANPPSGAIAVVFAPGPIIARLGGSAQDRSCAGDTDVPGCEQSGICSGPVYTSTSRCNPVNYLDVAGPPVLNVPLATASTEDNADFVDGTTSNGFIAGPIRDASDNAVVNDTLIVVRYSDLMPRLEQRVAREALKCLQDYANANGGHYPWAAPVSADYTVPLADQDNTYFGRIPQTLGVTATYALSGGWVTPCPVDMIALQDKWWANWSNLVFYAIATPYAPNNPIPSCGACLSVNPPPPSADKPVVVLVAGRPVGLQGRGVGALESAYLEDANATGSVTSIFKQAAATATFDDVAVFQ